MRGEKKELLFLKVTWYLPFSFQKTVSTKQNIATTRNSKECLASQVTVLKRNGSIVLTFSLVFCLKNWQLFSSRSRDPKGASPRVKIGYWMRKLLGTNFQNTCGGGHLNIEPGLQSRRVLEICYRKTLAEL